MDEQVPTVSARNRPAIVDQSRIGDWEADTIVGKDRKRIIDLIERVTRYTIICNWIASKPKTLPAAVRH